MFKHIILNFQSKNIFRNSQNSGDMDDPYMSLKPVEVSAISTTSKSINITWKCDLGGKDVNLYLYVICFSKYDESTVSINKKPEDMCKQRFAFLNFASKSVQRISI